MPFVHSILVLRSTLNWGYRGVGLDVLVDEEGKKGFFPTSCPWEIADELGKTAVFLASNDSFVTGIELFVDGGVAQI